MYLNVHSQYSLRFGTMSIPKLVSEAQSLGINQMVLTDINNSTGIMEFMRACKEKDIKPIGGIEFRRDKKLLYLGIARNKEGMKELNDFLTEYNFSGKPFPDQCKIFNNAYVIYPFSHAADLRENEFLGIRHDELNQLYVRDLAPLKTKLVALQSVVVADKVDYRLHEYLRGIDLNTLLTKVGWEDKCKLTDQFLPPGELEAKFSKYPFILDNTRQLMNRCVMDYSQGKIKLNRQTFTGNKDDDRGLLEKLAYEGMIYRYGKNNKQAARNVKQELKVIFELDFCAYFLITWDNIRYSMGQGFYHVGRGSGATSTVAYCLRITDV
ncbi:MAG: polymerase subunit alpha, partial [Pedobacter sp.]|nr:polymerase subunit alpha [Pedobacter sp.]